MRRNVIFRRRFDVVKVFWARIKCVPRGKEYNEIMEVLLWTLGYASGYRVLLFAEFYAEIS